MKYTRENTDQAAAILEPFCPDLLQMPLITSALVLEMVKMSSAGNSIADIGLALPIQADAMVDEGLNPAGAGAKFYAEAFEFVTSHALLNGASHT